MHSESKKARIVFLDRDGTLNLDHGYIADPDSIELISGAASSLGSIREVGYSVVVISNQSVVGRGMATSLDVDSCNERLNSLLIAENENASVDLFVYAVEAPEQDQGRRKPGIGMLEDVSKVFDFNPEECWMLGDKESDIHFGLNAGIPASQCLLLLTGQGQEAEPKLPQETPKFSSIVEATTYLLSKTKATTS